MHEKVEGGQKKIEKKKKTLYSQEESGRNGQVNIKVKRKNSKTDKVRKERQETIKNEIKGQKTDKKSSRIRYIYTQIFIFYLCLNFRDEGYVALGIMS